MELEVIAIRCYSWTCLVLFATGMGLWLFRLSRPASAPAPKSPSLSLSPETTAVISSDECCDNVRRTKGRFTAYFTADEGIVRCRKGKGCECANPDGREPLDWGWRGDLGWYRYQDWTAINGSVVTLWDTSR